MSQRTDRDATPSVQHGSRLPGDVGPLHTKGGGSVTPSVIYRELLGMGFGAEAAGNLTAYLNGIHPVDGGWTPCDIERLLFMRHLVERGWGDPRRYPTER